MTTLFKSSHDAAALGVLTADGEAPIKLASLADLVRHVMRHKGPPYLPLRAAASKVLDSVAADCPLPDLYLTDPADFACLITPETLFRAGRAERKSGTKPQFKTGWSATSWGAGQSQYREVPVPKQAAIAERRGVGGMLAELSEAWCINAKTVADLDKGRPARVALRYDVAAALFGLPGTAAAEPSAAAEQVQPTALAPAAGAQAADDALIVQPAGGVWPHVEGADWSDAEREAMFTMRHKNGMAGERIAKIAGVSRPRVDELIGKVGSPNNNQWPDACDWRPSAALLLACGFAVLQPLQAVAAELARA